MNRKTGSIFVILLFLVLGNLCFSQARKISADTHFVRKWSVGDGLPHPNIRAAVFDSENYLWLGTDRGLVRFDGTHFRRYRITGNNENPFPKITALFESSDRTLWIGTHAYGLISYDGCMFHFHPAAGSDPFRFVTAIDGTPDGKIWVGTADSGLLIYHPKTEKFFHSRSVISQRHITALVCDEDGSVWLGTPDKLYRYKEDRIISYSNLNGLPDNSITAITVKTGDRIWVGTGRGMAYADITDLTGDNHEPFKADGQTGEKYIHFLKYSKNGNLWISLPEGLKVQYVKNKQEGGLLTDFSRQFGLSSGPVQFLCLNRDGSRWFSQSGNGLFHIGRKRGKLIRSETGLSSHQVTSICDGMDSDVWVGTSDNGLNRISGNRIKTYSRNDGLNSNSIYSLYNDRNGNIWVGTAIGFCLYKDGKFHVDPQWRETIKSPVSGFCLTRKGEFWIGTMGEGLFLHRDGRFFPVDTKRGLHSDYILCMAEDINGDLMVGTSGGLNLVQNGKVRHFIEEETFIGKAINCILMEKDATLWVGTQENGLFLFRNTTPLVPEWLNYFEDEAIFGLSHRFQNQIILNSSKGIFYFIRKDNYTHSRWNKSEGTNYQMAAIFTKNDAYPGNTGTVIHHQRSGSLWISSSHGLFVLPEDEMIGGFVSKPKIKIESIETSGGIADFRKGLLLDGEFLKITASVPNYDPIKNYIFRYKLISLENSWWRREGIIHDTMKPMEFFDLPSGPFQLQMTGGYIFYNPTKADIEFFSFNIKSNPFAYPVIFVIALIMAIGVFVVLRRDKSQRELNLFYRGAGKDAGQPIPSREIRRHAAKLLRFMREQKPYLDANLSLATLGASLNMSKETLSQVVNRELNLNFNAFLNQYRVEEAKALLKDPAQNQFVILKIAYDVGFNSKSSFNAAFRQLTGMTPTQYRKKYQ